MRGLLCCFAVCLVCHAAMASERLVTLGGPVTEIVFGLGAGDQVVGVDASSTHPAEVKELPQIGYVSQISAEGLLSLEPDRILASDRLGPPAVVQQLRATGIPLEMMPTPSSAESLRDLILRLGELTSQVDQAVVLWNGIEKDLQKAQRLYQDRPRPTVVFLLGNQGAAMAAGGATQGGGLIRMAGAKNPFESFRAYQPVSEEALLEVDPAFILIGVHQMPGDRKGESLLKGMGLGRLADLGVAEILPVSLADTLSFGPRTGEAVLNLARIFHPEP